MTNAKPRAFYENQMTVAPYVLKLKNSQYDVGFYKEDGIKGYVAKADFFAGHIEKQIGIKFKQGMNKNLAPMAKLYSHYTEAAARNDALSKGYTFEKFVKADGKIQLRIGVN